MHHEYALQKTNIFENAIEYVGSNDPYTRTQGATLCIGLGALLLTIGIIALVSSA
jgi:multisubunit Na+/H+ antiporter MnhG subunit